MDQKGYRRGSFQSSTSDEDMLEIAGASLDFSVADDDPPLDREMGGQKLKRNPSGFASRVHGLSPGSADEDRLPQMSPVGTRKDQPFCCWRPCKERVLGLVPPTASRRERRKDHGVFVAFVFTPSDKHWFVV